MVKKLRKKFVVTAMSALLVIVIFFVAFINILNYYQITQSADNLLHILAENEGFFPEPWDHQGQGAAQNNSAAPTANTKNPAPSSTPSLGTMRTSAETPYETRYFWVRFDSNMNPFEVNTSHIASITSSEASGYANDVIKGGSTKGFMSSYRFLQKELSGGDTLVIFVDCGSSFFSAYSLFLSSLFIGAICLVAMFILVSIFAGRAVRPVVESLEKQKRFITDAGHELKTPLAIISADVDVIELDGVKNEWTQSIHTQIKRMTELISCMLTLSKLDESKNPLVFGDVDLSKLASDCAAQYRALAEASSKTYTIEVEDNIKISADRNALLQLFSLLLDNAMKYSTSGGSVTVKLSKGKTAVLEISNTCSGLKKEDLEKLFDRFYRPGASRNTKEGGHGIGLSVVRSITEAHGGKVSASLHELPVSNNLTNSNEAAAEPSQQMITFTVQLPLNRKAPKA